MVDRLKNARYIHRGKVTDGVPDFLARDVAVRLFEESQINNFSNADNCTMEYFEDYVSTVRSSVLDVPSFYIDTLPVTVDDYKNFLRESGIRFSRSAAMQEEELRLRKETSWMPNEVVPIAVTYHEAQAFCSWHGARLPFWCELLRVVRKEGFPDLLGLPAEEFFVQSGVAGLIDCEGEWTCSLIPQKNNRFLFEETMLFGGDQPLPLLDKWPGFIRPPVTGRVRSNYTSRAFFRCAYG